MKMRQMKVSLKMDIQALLQLLNEIDWLRVLKMITN